eukprot:scaffold1283_cov321-Prasinococcus_capsulatus_cf.AAC.7
MWVWGPGLAGVGVEGAVRRQDLRAAEAARLLARLVAGGVHDGRAAERGRAGGLRVDARAAAHLPRQPPGELVLRAAVGHLRHRGGLRGAGGPHAAGGARVRGEGGVRRADLLRLPAGAGGGRRRRRGVGRGDRGGHHAARDDAGRHGGGGAPGRPALRAPARAARGAPLQRAVAADHHRRGAGGHVLRHGRAPRPRVPLHLHGRGRHQRPRRRALPRPAALRGARARGGGAARGGPAARGGGQQDAPGPLLAHQGCDRAARQAAVVGALRGHGARRVRGGARRRAGDRAVAVRGGVVPLAGGHPRLVHLAAALVGPPHTGLLRAPPGRRPLRLRRHGLLLRDARPVGGGAHAGGGARARRGPLRRRGGGGGAGADAGRGRAGHLVQLGAVPLLHAGLAREHAGPGAVLPHEPAGDRARHPLLLGGAHGDDGHDAHGARALQAGLPARHGARRPRPQDVQVAGQRHRPAGGDRGHRARGSAGQAGGGQPGPARGAQGAGGPASGLPQRHPRVRHRRAALRAGGVHRAGARHQPGHQPRGGLPHVVQQALERHPFRHPQPRRGLRRARRGCAARAWARGRAATGLPLGAEPIGPRGGAGGGEHARVQLHRRHHGHLRLLAVPPLRRLHRAHQGGGLCRGGLRAGRQQGRRARHALDLPRRGPAPAAPLHALRHRGALAAPAARGGGAALHHGERLPGAVRGVARHRGGGGDGAHRRERARGALAALRVQSAAQRAAGGLLPRRGGRSGGRRRRHAGGAGLDRGGAGAVQERRGGARLRGGAGRVRRGHRARGSLRLRAARRRRGRRAGGGAAWQEARATRRHDGAAQEEDERQWLRGARATVSQGGERCQAEQARRRDGHLHQGLGGVQAAALNPRRTTSAARSCVLASFSCPVVATACAVNSL